jgi:hypothetical protein
MRQACQMTAQVVPSAPAVFACTAASSCEGGHNCEWRSFRRASSLRRRRLLLPSSRCAKRPALAAPAYHQRRVAPTHGHGAPRLLSAACACRGAFCVDRLCDRDAARRVGLWRLAHWHCSTFIVACFRSEDDEGQTAHANPRGTEGGIVTDNGCASTSYRVSLHAFCNQKALRNADSTPHGVQLMH